MAKVAKLIPETITAVFGTTTTSVVVGINDVLPYDFVAVKCHDYNRCQVTLRDSAGQTVEGHIFAGSTVYYSKDELIAKGVNSIGVSATQTGSEPVSVNITGYKYVIMDV